MKLKCQSHAPCVAVQGFSKGVGAIDDKRIGPVQQHPPGLFNASQSLAGQLEHHEQLVDPPRAEEEGRLDGNAGHLLGGHASRQDEENHGLQVLLHGERRVVVPVVLGDEAERLRLGQSHRGHFQIPLHVVVVRCGSS